MIRLAKLTPAQIRQRLKKLNKWKLSKGKIVKKFEFEDFNEAIDFIVKIAPFANELDHHPDIYNSYNKVVIELTTHDEKGITDKDFALAEKIDSITNK
jgi:4a-hydroxytetrahydrobiopterin dehydratase